MLAQFCLVLSPQINQKCCVSPYSDCNLSSEDEKQEALLQTVCFPHIAKEILAVLS